MAKYTLLCAVVAALLGTISARQTLKVGILVQSSGSDCAVGLQHWYMANYARQVVEKSTWWPKNDLKVSTCEFPGNAPHNAWCM
jgi:hypothetical protein